LVLEIENVTTKRKDFIEMF